MKLRTAAAGLTLALAVTAPLLTAQAQKPLDHSDYDVWNRIEGERLTPDGNWVAYSLVPGDGDRTLVLRETRGSGEWIRPRGAEARFTANSRWAVFSVEPSQEAVDAAKDEGKEGEALPKDSLAVVDLQALVPGVDPGGFVAERVRSFDVPAAAGEWVAYLLEALPRDDEAEEEAEADDEGMGKAEGTQLVLRHLPSDREFRFRDVTDYHFAPDGLALFYAAGNEEGTADGVYRVEVESGTVTPLITGEGEYAQLVLDETGTRAAFVTNRDDWGADPPSFALYVDDARVAKEGDPGIPEGWWVNQKGDVTFSEDGTKVFFGTAPRPAPEPDKKADEKDEVALDVWNWQDPYIMSMQLVQADQERDRAYTAVVSADGGPVVQLGTPGVPNVTLGSGGDAAVALGTTDVPYRQLLSWDGGYSDSYTIDVADGSRTLVAERVRSGQPALSPGSRYVHWWDGFERAWFAKSVDTGEVRDLSEAIPFPVHDLFDDRPEPPGPVGPLLWTEDDAGVVVPDWHDLWLIDPAGREPARNVTEGVGRREGLRFRYVRLDPEAEAVPANEDVLLSAFHLADKSDGFYRDRFDRDREPERLVREDVDFSTSARAEDADVVLLTRQTFREFPDLWVADGALGGLTKISNANPPRQLLLGNGGAHPVELQRRHPAPGDPLQARRLRSHPEVPHDGVLLRAQLRRPARLRGPLGRELIHQPELLREPRLRRFRA